MYCSCALFSIFDYVFLYFFHFALFSFFTLHSFDFAFVCVSIFSCSTLLKLHYYRVALFYVVLFHVALFLSCALFMLHFCTFFILHYFHAAFFLHCNIFTWHFLRVALISCCIFFRVELLSFFTFSVSHYFHVALLQYFHIALFSHCIIFILHYLVWTFSFELFKFYSFHGVFPQITTHVSHK